MVAQQKVISEKLAKLFGSAEATTANPVTDNGQQHMTELSKQAIEGVEASAGGAWGKVIWEF